MQELTKAQKSRLAIRIFKTTADALALRGFYKPSGKSGQKLEESLRTLSPEIYGSMNDARIIELKGLEYVIERLPRGIEECTRIILTAYEELENTSFEKIEPPKRRRVSYRVSDKEMCFVITRGASEIYDVLTHLTFLNVEARKIRNQMTDESGSETVEWRKLEEDIAKSGLKGKDLDQAVWNLSKILGRTYQEVKNSYEYLEKSRKESNSNNGLLQFIYRLGKRVEEEDTSKDNELIIYFTPSLRDIIGHHRSSEKWADALKEKLCSLGLEHRPLHIISANLHSVRNVLYGYSVIEKSNGSLSPSGPDKECKDNLYHLYSFLREKDDEVDRYASQHGMYELVDHSETHIDCQIIDTSLLEPVSFHPEIRISKSKIETEKPVLLVMDYAFGTQAFEVMDELLKPHYKNDIPITLNIVSISIMGKAGILPGKKGDIMLATAHVLEGTPHNYIVHNDLSREDFDGSIDVYCGPIVTVLGTSLQNRDVLEKFQKTSWRAVGLEMEGGHYQRAINAAIIRQHITTDVKVRYAYYASDNPLISGQTLAAGGMGKEGIKPAYMITKVILEKILN